PPTSPPRSTCASGRRIRRSPDRPGAPLRRPRRAPPPATHHASPAARRPAARPTAAPRDSTAPGRRTATRRPRGASDSADVPLDVGQQGELARPLDRRGELALVSRAHPRQSTRENLAALGQKTPERAIVLVVEHPDPGLAHRARLRGPSHASSSPITSTTASAAVTAAAGAGRVGRPSDTAPWE